MTLQKKESVALKFGLGLVAGQISIFWIHPFDLIKNRLQTGGANHTPFSCVSQILKQKGEMNVVKTREIIKLKIKQAYSAFTMVSPPR